MSAPRRLDKAHLVRVFRESSPNTRAKLRTLLCDYENVVADRIASLTPLVVEERALRTARRQRSNNRTESFAEADGIVASPPLLTKPHPRPYPKPTHRSRSPGTRLTPSAFPIAYHDRWEDVSETAGGAKSDHCPPAARLVAPTPQRTESDVFRSAANEIQQLFHSVRNQGAVQRHSRSSAAPRAIHERIGDEEIAIKDLLAKLSQQRAEAEDLAARVAEARGATACDATTEGVCVCSGCREYAARVLESALAKAYTRAQCVASSKDRNLNYRNAVEYWEKVSNEVMLLRMRIAELRARNDVRPSVGGPATTMLNCDVPTRSASTSQPALQSAQTSFQLAQQHGEVEGVTRGSHVFRRCCDEVAEIIAHISMLREVASLGQIAVPKPAV